MIETSSNLPPKSSAIFGNLRKMFGNVPESFGQFFQNLRKVVRNLRKIVKNVVFSAFSSRFQPRPFRALRIFSRQESPPPLKSEGARTPMTKGL